MPTHILQLKNILLIVAIPILVATVLKMLATGMTREEILKEYPDLEHEDIKACLDYAAWLASEKILPLVTSE